MAPVIPLTSRKFRTVRSSPMPPSQVLAFVEQEQRNKTASAVDPDEETLEQVVTEGKIFRDPWTKRMYGAFKVMNDREKLLKEMQQIDEEDEEMTECKKFPFTNDKHGRGDARNNAIVVLLGLDNEFITRALDGSLGGKSSLHAAFCGAPLTLDVGMIIDEEDDHGGKAPKTPKPKSQGFTAWEKAKQEPGLYGSYFCYPDGTYPSIEDMEDTVFPNADKYLDHLIIKVKRLKSEIKKARRTTKSKGKGRKPRTTISVPVCSQQSEELADFIQTIDSIVPTGAPSEWNINLSGKLKDAERKYSRTFAQLNNARNTVALWKRMIADLKRKHPNYPRSKPLPFTFWDVGWSADPARRAYQHYHHDSSIPFMNLIDSIARHFFPNKGLRIRVRMLYYAENWRLCSIAEHILSRLLGSYMSQGGFNVIIAGISVIKEKEIAEKMFEEKRQDAVNRDIFLPNFQVYVNRVRRWDSLVNESKRLEGVKAQYDDLYVEYGKVKKGLMTALEDFRESEGKLTKAVIQYMDRAKEIRKEHQALKELDDLTEMMIAKWNELKLLNTVEKE